MNFPKHKAGMFIEHNPHKNLYASVAQWHKEECISFESSEHYQRSCDSDEVWTLQWYPDTPIGFYIVAAPTLEECAEYANKISLDFLE